MLTVAQAASMADRQWRRVRLSKIRVVVIGATLSDLLQAWPGRAETVAPAAVTGSSLSPLPP